MSILYYQGQLDILDKSYHEHIQNNNLKCALKDCYDMLDCLEKIKTIIVDYHTKFPIEVLDGNKTQLYKLKDPLDALLFFLYDEEQIKKNIKNIIDKM